MVEPVTPLKALIIPNTGDLVGTWGSAALNPDFTAIDGMFGGVTTVSLTNANVSLSAPAGSITPGAGPNQQQNAVIKFSGTLTGNCTITFTLPGYYIVENNCTVGAFYVLLTGGAGNNITAPPGEACHVYSDGTNMKYVNMGRVGSYLDLAAATTPAWVSACTVAPYLLCDGSVYTSSVFPSLSAQLGSTFGGNGATTFGVPDLQQRVRMAIGTAGVGRVTTAGSGVNGATLGAAGGAQNLTLVAGNMPLQTTGTESAAHSHSYGAANNGTGGAFYSTGGNPIGNGTFNTGGESAAHAHVVGNASPSAATTLPPAIIAGVTLIKT